MPLTSALCAAIATSVLIVPANAQTVHTSPEGVVVRIAETPRLEKFVAPSMPSGVYRRTERGGSTRAELIIGPDGWVLNVRLFGSADAGFSIVSEAALKQWRYDPASLKGLPAPVRANVTIEFPAATPHNAGKLLFETDTYRVLANAGQSEWCFQNGASQASVSIVWRVGPDEDLSGTTAGYAQHLADIWTGIEKYCGTIAGLGVENYVAGVRLVNGVTTEVAENAALDDGLREMPINSLFWSKDATSGKVQAHGSAEPYVSLAQARAQRRPATTIALAGPIRTLNVAATAGASAPANAQQPSTAPGAPAKPAVSVSVAPPRAMAPAVSRPPGAPPPPPASVLPPLDVQGLDHREMIRTLYLGRFDRAPLTDSRNIAVITDEGIVARKLFASYVEVFSDQCSASLGAGKVPISRTITTTQQRKNYLGQVLGETDLGTHTEDTGILADADFAQPYVAIYNSASFEALVSLLRDLSAKRSDNLMQASLKLLGEMLAISVETRQLIARHGCDSPQIKRYAANALAYVTMRPRPPYVFDAFSYYCGSLLATYVPGAKPAGCGCARDAMKQALGPREFYDLSDDFTEQRFLTSVIARVGLRTKVAACIQ